MSTNVNLEYKDTVNIIIIDDWVKGLGNATYCKGNM